MVFSDPRDGCPEEGHSSGANQGRITLDEEGLVSNITPSFVNVTKLLLT